MKKIFLIRHGQASAGTDNYDRLSTLGIKQAELLGKYWQHSGFRPEAAFCGSLERQKDTARLALAGLTGSPAVKTVEALNEYNHNEIDRLFGAGLTSDSGIDLQFDQYLRIMQRWHDAGPESSGAESWDSFAQRGWQAVQSEAAASEARSLVFFTSGGIIATVLKQVMGLEFTPTMHAIWQTRNASVTQLSFDDSSSSRYNTCVVSYNSIPHLQLQYDKKLITQI